MRSRPRDGAAPHAPSHIATPSLTASALRLAAAKTLSFVFGFALPLVLVRRLSAEEFGVYKQLFLLVNTATILLPLGFAMSAFYFWPREARRRDAVVLHILLFHSFMTGLAGAAVAFWPALLTWIFQGGELARYANEIALLLVLWGASSVLETVAVARGEIPWAAAAIVALNLSRVLLLLGAALWAPSVDALATAAVAQGAIQMAALVAYLASRFGAFWRRFDPALLRAQLAYALPHGLASWLYWIHVDLHNYFVAHRFDDAAFAVYAVGCFQLPFLVILNESVGSVAIPRASRLQDEDRPREILALVAAMTRKLAAVYFPIFALLLVVRRELIVALFTEAYLPAAPIFAVHLALVPLAVVATAGDAVLRADARHRFFLVKLRLGLSVVTFAGLWIGTARFGLVGAIGAVVGVTLVERICVALKIASVLNVGRRELLLFRDPLKLAVAAGVSAFGAALVRSVLTGAGAGPLTVLLAGSLLFSGAYLGSVIALRVPRPDEAMRLRRRLEGWWRARARVVFAKEEPSA